MSRLSNRAYAPARTSAFAPFFKATSFNSTGETFPQKKESHQGESVKENRLRLSRTRKLTVISANKKKDLSQSKRRIGSPSPNRSPILLGGGHRKTNEKPNTLIPQIIIEKQNEDQEAINNKIHSPNRKNIFFHSPPAKKITLNGNSYLLKFTTSQNCSWVLADKKVKQQQATTVPEVKNKMPNRVYYKERKPSTISVQSEIGLEKSLHQKKETQFNSQADPHDTEVANNSFINQLNIKTEQKLKILAEDNAKPQLNEECAIEPPIQIRILEQSASESKEQTKERVEIVLDEIKSDVLDLSRIDTNKTCEEKVSIGPLSWLKVEEREEGQTRGVEDEAKGSESYGLSVLYASLKAVEEGE